MTSPTPSSPPWPSADATSVITTVHPMGSDRATQHRIGVQGTTVLARAAASAGVERLIHISTAAVYDRSPGIGDVDESSALVGDDANDYAVTKRDTDLALADVDGHHAGAVASSGDPRAGPELDLEHAAPRGDARRRAGPPRDRRPRPSPGSTSPTSRR